MEHKNQNLMTPFDQLISNQNLQMMKLLIPYTPPETQRFLAVYVKFSELQYTLDFFQHFKQEVHAQEFEKKICSPLEIVQEIRPYLPEEALDTVDNIANIFHMIELLETFRETSDSLKDTDSGLNPMSMMKTMLTPEQQSMFDMYSTMFAQNSAEYDTEKKGDESND